LVVYFFILYSKGRIFDMVNDGKLGMQKMAHERRGRLQARQLSVAMKAVKAGAKGGQITEANFEQVFDALFTRVQAAGIQIKRESLYEDFSKAFGKGQIKPGSFAEKVEQFKDMLANSKIGEKVTAAGLVFVLLTSAPFLLAACGGVEEQVEKPGSSTTTTTTPGITTPDEDGKEEQPPEINGGAAGNTPLERLKAEFGRWQSYSYIEWVYNTHLETGLSPEQAEKAAHEQLTYERQIGVRYHAPDAVLTGNKGNNNGDKGTEVV
jgi:hypothetical protein